MDTLVAIINNSEQRSDRCYNTNVSVQLFCKLHPNVSLRN